MHSLFKTLAALGVAVALTGCAGTNFKRPEPQALQVGKSTSADVTRVMGPPSQTGESLRNGTKLKVARYAYAEGASAGMYPGVVPARAMALLTSDNLLVAQEFVSSFKDDATDFDDSKVTAILKGKSTRAEVLALMGKPSGDAVYPFIRNQGESALLYSYAQAKGSVFDMKFHSKMLVVSFDAADVVTDIEFTSNGTK
jgi:outer membrane protein assembly factor BamE (lipoprotein component of BamABCDE complex)